MNKEVDYNIFLIHNNYELIKKYVKNTKSNDEFAKTELLSKMILDFYKKVFNNEVNYINNCIFSFDFYTYGYNLSDGYYVIYSGYSGYYEVITYKNNIDNAFMDIMANIIERQSYENVYNNRAYIEKEYKDRFGNINILWNIYESEYALDKLDKYYDGNIPEQIINKYLNKIKIENGLVYYDIENKEIIIKKQTKIKSLEKD